MILNVRALIASIPQIGRDSLLLAPGYIVPGLVSLVLIPLLFGSLGASQYGVLALILAVANGVPQLTTSWLEAVLVRFAHRGDFETSWRAVALALVASGLVGALVAALFIPTADTQVIAITTIFTGSVGAYLIVAARLQSLLRFGAVSRGATVRSVVGGILAVLLGLSSGTASIAAIGLAIGFLVGTLIMFADARGPANPPVGRSEATRSTEAQHRTGRHELARYGAGSLAVAASLYVLSVGDRFVLSAVRPLSDVGIYAATYGIVDLLFRLVPTVVIVAVRPQIFRAWDRGDRSHVLSLVILVASMLAWLLGILSIGLIALAAASVRLPMDALLAGPITIGLGAFIVASSFALVYSASKRQGRLGLNLAVAATLNVGLNIAFDPSLGAYGAALATFIGYTALLALNLWGLRPPSGAQPRRLLAVLAICLAATGANGLVSGTAAWPIGALVGGLSLVVVAPLIVRHIRLFPWPGEAIVDSTGSGSQAGTPEDGQPA